MKRMRQKGRSLNRNHCRRKVKPKPLAADLIETDLIYKQLQAKQVNLFST